MIMLETFYRWSHPAQQQGRRIPPLSFEIALVIRMPRVSAFLPEVIQQIHSLRAKGVMSFHNPNTDGLAVRTFRISGGST